MRLVAGADTRPGALDRFKERFGDSPGDCVVKLWSKRCYSKAEGDVEFPIGRETGSQGGANPRTVGEIVRYVRKGGKITTSPIAAHASVTAGCLAADSVRNGSMPPGALRLPRKVLGYFNRSWRRAWDQ